MDPARTRPPEPETGHEHPKCYARTLKDCSARISREHYISESVLLELGPNFLVTREQLGWRDKPLGTNALASNILCERHNSALSPLDATAQLFFRALRRGTRNGVQRHRGGRCVLNGIDVERWFLKTLCGYTSFDGDEVPEPWLRTLFGYREIDSPAGLRMNASVGDTNESPDLIEYATGYNNRRERVGCSVTLSGWRFVLSLDGRPLLREGEAIGEGVYRPVELQFGPNGGRRFFLEMMWPRGAREAL